MRARVFGLHRQGVTEFGAALFPNEALSSLTLSQNPLGDEGVLAAINMLYAWVPASSSSSSHLQNYACAATSTRAVCFKTRRSTSTFNPCFWMTSA